jgi:uncharacterized protein YjiS (DUF1127 family)
MSREAYFSHRDSSAIDAESLRKRNVMLATVVRFVREWRRYQQSVGELSRLGDRELADIGISRSDIPRVAWNTSHRG